MYETVPQFEDKWIEYLGDLASYRMAIEDNVIYDCNVWANNARFWYSKAVDKISCTGRMHHRLAVLAWSNTLQKLSRRKILMRGNAFPPAIEITAKDAGSNTGNACGMAADRPMSDVGEIAQTTQDGCSTEENWDLITKAGSTTDGLGGKTENSPASDGRESTNHERRWR